MNEESKAPYQKCTGHGGTCQADCAWYDPDVCYGTVSAVEAYDGIFVHFCKAHEDKAFNL